MIIARVSALLLACMATACSGVIGDDPASPTGGSGATTGGRGGETTGGGTNGAASFAPGALHRITSEQYRSSIRDLLGDGVMVTADLEEDATIDGLSSIGAASLALSRSGIEKYEKSASDLAKQAFANASLKTKLVGCEPKAPGDEACARTFVQSFGRRAFRRPLGEDELGTYVALSSQIGKQSGDAWLGLEMTLSGILQSPHFLYRVELGTVDPAGPPDALRLEDHEVATRLSYLLLGTTPSPELLDLADRGQLSTAAGLEQQARKILLDPRAGTVLADFFVEMIGLEDLPRLTKSMQAFPTWTGSLATAMDGEIRMLFSRFAFERAGSLLDLYDTRDAFVNADLAVVYGLPAPGGTGLKAVTHPEGAHRAGLLTTAGFLARHAFADRTSATERGKAIRQSLLCQSVPPPPNNVIPELPPSTPDHPLTARERLAGHATNPSCAGCHTMMDPIGLGLEHFDAIGRYRETDQGLTIDASGQLDGASYRDAVGLAGALRQHPDAGACLVKQLYRHATGHREDTGEEALVSQLAGQFAAGGERFPEFLLRFVTSDAFRYVSRPR